MLQSNLKAVSECTYLVSAVCCWILLSQSDPASLCCMSQHSAFIKMKKEVALIAALRNLTGGFSYFGSLEMCSGWSWAELNWDLCAFTKLKKKNPTQNTCKPAQTAARQKDRPGWCTKYIRNCVRAINLSVDRQKINHNRIIVSVILPEKMWLFDACFVWHIWK